MPPRFCGDFDVVNTMLLFSTVLPAAKGLDPHAFYETMIDWNQNYSRAENQISSLEWNDGFSQTFCDENLKMEFDCLEEEGLYGARFTKDENGVLWRTDALYLARKQQILVQLDRSYIPGAAIPNQYFATPKLIETMIDHQLLEKSDDLPVSVRPLELSVSDSARLEAIFYGPSSPDLPIVLVSPHETGSWPVDLDKLAWRLKGAAHVIGLQSETGPVLWWKENFSLQMPQAGLVSITYPNATRSIEYIQPPLIDASDFLMEEICSRIFRYNQMLENANQPAWMLLKAHKVEKAAAEESRIRNDETAQFTELFDLMNNDRESLSAQLIALQAENNAMHQALKAANRQEQAGILVPGREEEFYPGEIRDYVMEALKQVLNSSYEQGRKADLIRDLVESNPSGSEMEKRRELIRQAMNREGSAERWQNLLVQAGFEISEEGKHYKLVYGKDKRYTFTIGKTPSDVRASKNNVSIILQKLFK